MVGFESWVREMRVGFLSQSIVSAGAQSASCTIQQNKKSCAMCNIFNPMIPRMDLETRKCCIQAFAIAIIIRNLTYGIRL